MPTTIPQIRWATSIRHTTPPLGIAAVSTGSARHLVGSSSLSSCKAYCPQEPLVGLVPLNPGRHFLRRSAMPYGRQVGRRTTLLLGSCPSGGSIPDPRDPSAFSQAGSRRRTGALTGSEWALGISQSAEQGNGRGRGTTMVADGGDGSCRSDAGAALQNLGHAAIAQIGDETTGIFDPTRLNGEAGALRHHPHDLGAESLAVWNAQLRGVQRLVGRTPRSRAAKGRIDLSWSVPVVRVRRRRCDSRGCQPARLAGAGHLPASFGAFTDSHWPAEAHRICPMRL